MMKLIFYCYWQVCLLKNSPENTPYSHFLLGLSAILFALTLIIQWQFSDIIFSDDVFIILMIAISLIFSFIVYCYIILLFKGFIGRLVQTLTCIFCTQLIIHILACPLVLLEPYLVNAHIKNPLVLFIGVMYLFITLGLSVWQFVITAHIFKYALSTTAIQSVLAAFGLMAVNILTVSLWR